MNTKALADAIFTTANALYQLAEAIESEGQDEPAAGPPVAATPSRAMTPAPPDLPPAEDWVEDLVAQEQTVSPIKPQGSEAICPKHRTPYKPGRYGPFCSQRSDEPKWANDRGYCTITPKNAAAWLRQHAATPA